MNNKQNSNEKDKLRVITAEEVLEELRRRKKETGSVFLPTNSYQVIKNGKVVRDDNNNLERVNKTNNSKNVFDNDEKVTTSNTSKNQSLRRAVLFLENFAFKKPLQSIFTVLMLLGITTGMYIATRPVGELDNRNIAAVPETVYMGIVNKDQSQYTVYSKPNIYCKATDLNSTFDVNTYYDCLAKNIITLNISKIVVITKPDFLNLSYDPISRRILLTTTRVIKTTDQEINYQIKILGIPNDQSSYKLLYFTLRITDAIAPNSVGKLIVKNPINYQSAFGCEALDDSKAKLKWQTYNTESDCTSALHSPTITTPSAINVDYETQCHNNPSLKTVAFNVSATDQDGDLTRFEIDSSQLNPNNSRIEESLDTYIQRVTSDVENGAFANNYGTYQYSNSIKMDLIPQDIGTTIPVKVRAINQNTSSYNSTKVINVHVNEKVVNTSPNMSVSITSPKTSDVVKGVSQIMWSVNNSCDFTRYKVELWNKYCTTYKAQITNETLVNVSNLGSAFNTSWDSRNTPDGDYCVRVFARNSVNEAWKVANTGTITVQNANPANHSPKIISLPSTTNIKVGDIFNYTVKTSDQDNDTVSLVIDKKPDWLTLSGNTLSGSTNTVGAYTVSIRAKDSKGAYSTSQIFTINVATSTNTPTTIAFTAFPTSGNISGTYIFKWTVTDPNGIKAISVSISSDGTTWTKIADPKTTDSSSSIDTTKYSNGQYYLKLSVTDNQNDVVEKVTDSFVINNSLPKTAITIATYDPSKDSKITNVRPVISLKVVLPTGITFDASKMIITLDETLVTSLCKYDNSVITCTLDKDLAIGVHKVSIEYYDNLGAKGSDNWQFEIVNPTSASSSQPQVVDTSSSDTITIFGRTISKALGILLLVLIIAGILIFLVPLVIFRIWKKKDSGNNTPDNSGPSNPPVVSKSSKVSVPSTEKKVPNQKINEAIKNEQVFSYNTKKEFDLNGNTNNASDWTKVYEKKKEKELSNILTTNTPVNNTIPSDQNSSFQSTNKYDNVPQNMNNNLNDISEPNKTWGLAGRYKAPDTAGNNNGTV